MPRYRYQCEKCEDVTTIFHLISEQIKSGCTVCEATGSLTKLLNTTIIKKDDRHMVQEQKTGDLTKQFIEENREILKNQKKEKDKRHVKV